MRNHRGKLSFFAFGILIGITAVGLTMGSAKAATVSFINDTGGVLDFRIASIQGLSINDNLFDITYTYDTSWNDTGLTPFFTTQEEAADASDAVGIFLNSLNLTPQGIALTSSDLITVFADNSPTPTIEGVSASRTGPDNPFVYSTQILLDLSTTDILPTRTGFASYTGVSPVPLPAALPLYLSAIAGFGFMARRKKQQRDAGKIALTA